jgi:hypothetical protein
VEENIVRLKINPRSATEPRVNWWFSVEGGFGVAKRGVFFKSGLSGVTVSVEEEEKEEKEEEEEEEEEEEPVSGVSFSLLFPLYGCMGGWARRRREGGVYAGIDFHQK